MNLTEPPPRLRSVAVSEGSRPILPTGFHPPYFVFVHRHAAPMVLAPIVALVAALFRALQRLIRPARSAARLVIGAAKDLTRTRSELLAENAMRRQQVIVLRRGVDRARIHDDNRLLLLILARLTGRWRGALHVVCPETLLRWHPDLIKIVWRRKSRPMYQPRRRSPELVTLIRTMAKDNVLWGAERIRGELLKLGVRVGKRTILGSIESTDTVNRDPQAFGRVHTGGNPGRPRRGLPRSPCRCRSHRVRIRRL